MTRVMSVDFDDELDDDERAGAGRVDTRRRYGRMTKRMAEQAARFVREQTDARSDFKFTYEPARFEEWWLLISLGELYEHRWIADVLRRVRSGKEASVYQCQGGQAVGTELAAAKVYRPWSLRNLRNDGTYRQGRADLDAQGRVVIDDGMLHAIEKKTEYGRQLLHQSWMAYEFKSLQSLHAAGADVPEPYVMTEHAILMGFIGDRDVFAPMLQEVNLERAEARRLFDRVIGNIDLLLSREYIHGDLSAYNILYWKGSICIIDFPQVVSPGENRNAYAIFVRDVTRICDYFARQGVRADAEKISREIWEAHSPGPRGIDPQE